MVYANAERSPAEQNGTGQSHSPGDDGLIPRADKLIPNQTASANL
jgi:hypothetical protein